MCESVPRYVKRRYYMHAAARRGGFTARWEIRTRDVRVTRLGDARRRVVCVRRRWRRERLSERGESETAESRESRTRSSRHATDESQSDQSPHQCVSKMCLSGLRRGPSCHVEHNVDMIMNRGVRVHARRGRGTLGPGSSVQCPCAQSAPTLSLRMAYRTFCFKSLTQPEPVYRPRASSARCACQYTPKACTLTIISWYLRGPVARAGALVAGEAVHMSREACVGSEGGSSKIATSKVLRSARDP
jgi:hypothetical protein